LFFQSADQSADPNRFQHVGYDLVGEIPRVKWDPALDFAEKVIAQGVPVILTNTIVDKWEIRTKWTPKYLSSIPNKINITFGKQSHQKVLPLYRGDQPLGNLSYLKFEPPTRKKEMTIRQFWEKIQKTDEVLYCSQNIETFGDFLSADIPSFDWFMGTKGKLVNSLLWMGSKGSTTPTHYDKSVNFHAQIYGKKRFILSSPSTHRSIYLYPSLHPQRLQSQVSFEEPVDKNVFPLFQDIQAVHGLLSPGELLYIPPYWFHRVTTEVPGISINFWSYSVGMSLEDSLKSVMIPVSQNWDIKTRTWGLKSYFDQMFATVFPESPDLINQMVALQMKPLIKSMDFPNKLNCEFLESDFQYLQATQLKKIHEAILQTVPLVETIEDKSVQEMELFGFIEKLVSICLGSNFVFPFFDACY